MQTYDSCKNSGIDWLGEIPSHWEVKKITYLFTKIGSGTTPTAGSVLYYENGTINFLQTGDLNDGFINQTSKKITQKALEDNTSLKLFPKGSLVIAMYGATIGKLGILNIDTTTNQACCVLGGGVKDLDTKFIFYWFSFAKRDIISMSYGGGQPNISQDLIKSLRIHYPPISEQEAIAAFLDEKCGKIDELVSVKEKQIALLKERRQVVIHEAVTKGIQPNVELKDSGIDWIGEIPKHWEVGPLKYLTTKIVDGAHFTPTYVDEGIPFLRVTDISKSGIDRKIDWNSVKFIPIQEHKELIKRANPEKGDILLSKNGTIGLTRVIDWNEEFSFFVSLCLIKPTKRLSPFYFEFFFNCPLVDRQINDSSSRTSVTNLHLEKIKELLIVLPPISEQETIVAYLEEQTGKIDQAIALKTEQIEKLKAYKQSLINEVVTGKVKVA